MSKVHGLVSTLRKWLCPFMLPADSVFVGYVILNV